MHGISYGAAIDISTCCDIRLCTRDTIFSVREVAIGLAADLGTLSRLPQTGVSMSFIKDVALTARDWDAAEALQVGFVSGVYEDKGKALERAMELARTIAEKSPVAVQGTKAVVNYSRDHSIEDGEFLSFFLFHFFFFFHSFPFASFFVWCCKMLEKKKKNISFSSFSQANNLF